MLPWGWNTGTARAWTPEEIMDSIAATVENLQREGKRFAEYIEFGAVGHTCVIVPESALGFMASACFDLFEPKLSQFFEARVCWQRVMSYHKANPSASIRRITHYVNGRDDEKAAWTTDLRTAHGEYLQLGEGNASFYGWDLSSLSDDQRREVYARMNDRKFPDSWSARQRRQAEKDTSAAGY